MSMAAHHLHTLTDHALAYVKQGLEIFPVSPTDKAPLTTNGMKDATRDVDQIRRWWSQNPDALIGCRIPEHLVILDIDPRHGGADTWNELTNSYGNIEANRIHASGRGDGGRHRWYKRPPGKLSVKLLNEWAQRAGVGHQAGKRSWSSGIDILHHDHRYTILPPSPHPETHNPYTWVAETRAGDLHPAVAALITTPATPLNAEPVKPLRLADENSIADWFSGNHSWPDILTPAGWLRVEGDGDSDGSKWRHPNATAHDSCSIKHGCLFVYSPNTDFDVTEDGDPRGYTRFRAWAVLEHDGDLKRAARAAYELREPGVGDPIRALPGPAPETPEEQNQYDQDLLALLLDWPTFWKREVTEANWLIEPVIAAGRAHALYAPGGTGKSLLSLWLAAQTATGGVGLDGMPLEPRRVLYLDYEMTQDDLIERLEHMGFDAESVLDNLSYALLPALPPADAPEGGKAIGRLAELVDAEVVFIDTFSRAVAGDENEADTVRSFYRWTGLHLKAAGRAFCRIDHAGKDLEKGQRGSSAKNDDVDVVWQMVKADNGFTLTAKKRRMGWVPETISIAQYDEPNLYYRVVSDVDPKGTASVIADLDDLAVSSLYGYRVAAKALRDAGRGARAEVVRAAQKIRNQRISTLRPVDKCVPPVDKCVPTFWDAPQTGDAPQAGGLTGTHPANHQVTDGTHSGTHPDAPPDADGVQSLSLDRDAPSVSPPEPPENDHPTIDDEGLFP